MKKTFFISTLSSFTLGANLLLAIEPSFSKDTSIDGANALSKKEDQSHEAAAMIESFQAAQDNIHRIDKEQYAESWSTGDQIFQHALSKEEWIQALNESRKSLGKVKFRKLKDQRLARNPPGLPKGDYMVVEYNTSFENAPSSVELLTLRKGSDGKWRLLTYQVN